MQCPHCGNEVYQQITAFNPVPNVNGCNSTMTSVWIDDKTPLNTIALSGCAVSMEYSSVIINSLDITTNASEQQ